MKELAFPKPRKSRQLILSATLPLLLLAGCATPSSGSGGTSSPSTESTHIVEPEGSSAPASQPEATEASAASPRLAITYEGGIQLLDAVTLDSVGTIELDGFNRLNDAGDGRHFMVSTAGGFQLLDSGTWAVPHGDHAHYYTSAPTLTDITFSAQTPGHAIAHGGHTALFDDATGEIVVLESSELTTKESQVRQVTTPSAHHGVAIALTDGSLITSNGTADLRTGIQVLDSDNTQVASSDQCPGIHGAAVAANETVVTGCEDGALIVKGTEIIKVSSPDTYGRIGNLAASTSSPVVLGDYKSSPDAKPTKISLINTNTDQLALVEIPSSYSFRSLARGDTGEALVLGTDGNIHVIDAESGKVTSSIPVINPWEEPAEWQAPRPSILALDGSIYVTDPATNTLFAVDVETGEVWNSTALEVTPNELSGVLGLIPNTAEADAHEHDEDHHDHEH